MSGGDRPVPRAPLRVYRAERGGRVGPGRSTPPSPSPNAAGLFSIPQASQPSLREDTHHRRAVAQSLLPRQRRAESREQPKGGDAQPRLPEAPGFGKSRGPSALLGSPPGRSPVQRELLGWRAAGQRRVLAGCWGQLWSRTGSVSRLVSLNSSWDSGRYLETTSCVVSRRRHD